MSRRGHAQRTGDGFTTEDHGTPRQLPGRLKVGSGSHRQHRRSGSKGAIEQGGRMESTDERRGWRGWIGKAALAGGGLLVGGVLVGTLTASAADTPSTADQTVAYGAPGSQRAGGDIDESKSQRPDEQLLTGDTASKVRAAALARYPGATVLRVETDSDGVYEAHLTTTDGQRVTVEVDKDFKVTGEESAPARP
jgi:hypothetical protein